MSVDLPDDAWGGESGISSLVLRQTLSVPVSISTNKSLAPDFPEEYMYQLRVLAMLQRMEQMNMPGFLKFLGSITVRLTSRRSWR
jgi:hypothetical protein